MKSDDAKYILNCLRANVGMQTVAHMLEEATVPCKQEWAPRLGMYICDKCHNGTYHRTRFCPECGKEVSNYEPAETK